MYQAEYVQEKYFGLKKIQTPSMVDGSIDCLVYKFFYSYLYDHTKNNKSHQNVPLHYTTIKSRKKDFENTVSQYFGTQWLSEENM